MADLTQAEKDVDIALNVAEKFVIPLLASFNPQVGALLMAAVKGARTVQQQLNLSPAAAVSTTTAHNTPGAPNTPVLSG